MSVVREDIAASVQTHGNNINSVVSFDCIAVFKKRLADRGVIATKAMIKAVLANGGKWVLEKHRLPINGGWSKWVEIYPTEHWSEMSCTTHLTASDWRSLGIEDCKNGSPCQSDNESYQWGYGYQYELEAKQSAMCLH